MFKQIRFARRKGNRSSRNEFNGFEQTEADTNPMELMCDTARN